MLFCYDAAFFFVKFAFCYICCISNWLSMIKLQQKVTVPDTVYIYYHLCRFHFSYIAFANLLINVAIIILCCIGIFAFSRGFKEDC